MTRENIETRSEENEGPLFLFSPPGSMEASWIGYINIPKISIEPPIEILGEKGLHSFEDASKDTYLQPCLKDEKDKIYHLHPSNVWIREDWVMNLFRNTITDEQAELLTDKGEVQDPKFPRQFQYAIKWILLEYALHCHESGNFAEDFADFVRNIVRRKVPEKWMSRDETLDHVDSVLIALLEKDWQGAKSDPIWYLRATLGNRRIIEQSIITGQSLTTESEMLLDMFYLEDIRIKEHETDSVFKEICRRAGLTPEARLLLKTAELGERPMTLAEAAASLDWSLKEYDAKRKELIRKKDKLQQAFQELDLTFGYRTFKMPHPKVRKPFTRSPHKCPKCSKTFLTLYSLSACEDHVDDEEIRNNQHIEKIKKKKGRHSTK